jgi:ABC-2 type transport system permease protein
MGITLHYLRLQRLPLMIWALVGIMLTSANAASVGAVTADSALTDLIKTLPEAFQRILGSSFLSLENPVDGFIAMKVLMSLPVLFGVYAVMSAAAVVAKEQENRSLDFLLALPIDRGRVLQQRFVAIAVGLITLYAVTWASLFLFLEALGHPGSYGKYALTMLGYLAINLAQAGLALAFSIGSWTYSQVVRFGLAFVLLTYILDMSLMIGGVGESLRYVLLYGTVQPIEMMESLQVPWTALFIGLPVAGISLWWAQRSFSTKQLQG